MRQAKVRYNLLKKTNGIVVMLAVCVLTASVNAQQRDPRIGEWREDRTATSVGQYNIFEDLGNGMIRYHMFHNLAPENRLYLDYRCDGNLYPIRNSKGVVTDFSQSCSIVDANTVTLKSVQNKDKGFTGPRLDDHYWFDGEGTGTLSRDGNHYRVVWEQKDGVGKVIRTSERTFTRNAERCFSPDEEKFRECQRRTSPPRK
jgi:hypothetical protein